MGKRNKTKWVYWTPDPKIYKTKLIRAGNGDIERLSVSGLGWISCSQAWAFNSEKGDRMVSEDEARRIENGSEVSNG